MRQTADPTAPDATPDPAPGPAVPCWPAAAPEPAPDALVGREPDLRALDAVARGREPSFVTLVGVGGVGKSRLALEVAARAMAAHDGRVATVALDAVSDPAMVLPAIAGALGVADEPGRPLSDALGEALRTAPALLVLDTMEHVRPAAPALADLRARTPGLTILATSRVPLGVPRERVVRVEPLPVPAPGDADAAVLAANPAVTLFLDRARAVRPDVTVTDANAALLGAICRRLDGLPLAIELAAAALRVLAPHQLLDQLSTGLADAGAADRDAELGAGTGAHAASAGAAGGRGSGAAGHAPGAAGGHNHAPGAAGHAPGAPTPAHGAPGHTHDHEAPGAVRRRSLRAAMDWSLGLLDPEVRRLYRRLGVLSGPFSRATAASLLERGELRGLAPLGIDLDEGLETLADASLLRRDPAGADGPAYAMLTTVRADALERLGASGEGVAMRWAHAYEVLALVEWAEGELPTEREVAALDRLDEAHDDIREALDWATERGDGAFTVRLAGALAEFWRTRGHHTEGRLRLAAALALAHDGPAPYRRRALAGAGLLASYQGDYVIGESYLREALAVARTEGDDEACAVVLNWLGTNAYGRGDLDAAEGYVSESLALRRAIGEPVGIAAALNALGGVYHFRGELDRAREVFVESLALKQALGNANSIAVSLVNLGLVERDAGRPDDAAGAFAEAIGIWERTGDRQRVAVGLHNAALVHLDLHRLDEAARDLDGAIAIARSLGDRTEVVYALADRARVDVERGRLREAGEAIAEALPKAVAQGARIILPLAMEGAAALAAARGDDARAVRLWAAASAERASSGFANMPADERHLDERMAEVRSRLVPEAFAAAWGDGASLSTDDAVALALAVARAAA